MHGEVGTKFVMDADNEGALILATLLERRQSVQQHPPTAEETDHEVPISPTSPDSDSSGEVFGLDDSGNAIKGKRGPQKCRRCGLPRKGHKCLALDGVGSNGDGVHKRKMSGEMEHDHSMMAFAAKRAAMDGRYPIVPSKENMCPSHQMGTGAAGPQLNLETFVATISARYGIPRADLDQLYRDCCIHWRPMPLMHHHPVGGQTVVAVASAAGHLRGMGGERFVAVSMPTQQHA